MRVGVGLLAGLCAATMSAQVARAQTGPVVAIPGKPGIPVIIDGLIVDGAVVYGDWGLARPGQRQIIIEGPVFFAPQYDDERGYYPATGRRPRVGRHEIDTPSRVPRPTSFRREWNTGSDMHAPVTEYPPFEPPAVIYGAPQRARPRPQPR